MRPTRSLIAIARLAGAALLVVVVPSILFAHARLVRSQPSAGQHLTAAPTNIRLVFSETPMVPVSRVFLLDARGDTILLGPLYTDSADAHVVSGEITIPLDSGSYTVIWSTAASDGHASHGGFGFVVDTPVAHPLPASAMAPEVKSRMKMGVAGNESSMDAVELSYPMILARWIGFLALFSLVGAVAFRYLVLGRLGRLGQLDEPFGLIASTGAATFGLFAAIALVIATLAKLVGEIVAMQTSSAATILIQTSWGWALMVQITAAIVAIVAFRIAHSAKTAAWSLAALCALVLTITPALMGHAMASDNSLFMVPLDILHVLAGSVWLGTLAVVMIVGIGSAVKTPGDGGVAVRVASMVNAFSPVALTCGGTIVATGVIVSLLRLEPLSTLWTSGYGQVLILKLGLVMILFALGAWNWRRVKPTLGGDEGVLALRRSAKMELTAGMTVLGVTALLVAMALPG